MSLKPIGQPHPRNKTPRRGHRVDPKASQELATLLTEQPLRRDRLIEYLHKIQDQFGCIKEKHRVALADALGLAPVEVHEVASFYHHFRLSPSGKQTTLRVCTSISCSMAGSDALLEQLQIIFGDDLDVQSVPCVGRCEQAPVAVLGQNPIGRAYPDLITQALDSGHQHGRIPAAAEDYQGYLDAGGYRQLKSLHSDKEEETADSTTSRIFQTLDDSGLRGLGGAGFPMGRKWRSVAAQAGPRLLAVNIDEGEPGTFKDRYFLEQHPHRLLEGALIAAQVVGCEGIYFYIRDEYTGCRLLLEREIAALQANPPVPLPSMELRRGAGAYICGEESAMIESIEGKRGMPRQRPPYVAAQGLFGLPTLVHNAESLMWVPQILTQGPEFFSSEGRRGRHGLRAFSVSGRVARPGVYLAPAGISVRELVDEYAGGMADGHELYGYFPGGASGGMLPASLSGLPLDFDTLSEHCCFIGSAAVIVFSRHDSARELALNAMKFFAHESCGQCTPCRVGTVRAVSLMEQPDWDRATLEQLAQVMQDASICGLGQAAPNPMLCALRYFPQEFPGTDTRIPAEVIS